MRGQGEAGGGGEADGEMLVFRLHAGVVLAVRRHAVGGGASACAEVGFNKQNVYAVVYVVSIYIEGVRNLYPDVEVVLSLRKQFFFFDSICSI
jgi:hypothetical protein